MVIRGSLQSGRNQTAHWVQTMQGDTAPVVFKWENQRQSWDAGYKDRGRQGLWEKEPTAGTDENWDSITL